MYLQLQGSFTIYLGANRGRGQAYRFSWRYLVHPLGASAYKAAWRTGLFDALGLTGVLLAVYCVSFTWLGCLLGCQLRITGLFSGVTTAMP